MTRENANERMELFPGGGLERSLEKIVNEDRRNIPRMKPIKEVSALTGISYDAIRKKCLKNEIAYIRCGNKFLINLDRFIDYLNGGQVSKS